VNGWTIDFNVDGMWYKGHESDWNNSTYQLMGQDEQTLFVNSTVRNTHKLYATKLVLTHPLAGGSLSFGGEYSYSKRTNLYTNPQGIVADDDSHSIEDIASAFVEYGRQIGKVSLQAGVRYEHVAFDYYIQHAYRKDLSRSTGDFFPSLALSFPIGKVQMQLGYAKDIQRPSFGELSSEVTYNNRYTYQTGNPLLLPMTTDNISLNAIYRWASLSVGYQHIKNKVFYSSAPYSEEKPDVMLLSLTNHPSYDFCFASLTLSPKIGFWSPQLSGQFTKQWIKMETHEGVVNANKPIFSLVWRNDFKLPQGFVFNASLNYQTKGHYENAYKHIDTWKMDFSLQKSFLKNRLNVQLSAKNPFQTYQNNSFVAYFGKMQTWFQDYNNSQYSYTLNIRYKFNTTKSKYKGTGAGASQKARM
jgi:outer membrane receptor protein involved in Fe transport